MIPLLIGSLVLLLLLGCPLVFSLGFSSALVLLFDFPTISVAPVNQKMLTAIDSFMLIAIPLFLLAGNLMNSTGVTRRLFRFAKACVGHIPGGLGHANVVISMFFAGMSGSAVADAAGLGTVEIPEMVNHGYDLDFSAAITAASATIGPVIPPSIPMIIYASIAGVSVTRLFIAGVIPGIIIGIALMIYVYFVSIKQKYPKEKSFDFREFWLSLKESFFALLAPAIILGGILFGVFTATEAAVIAVIYILIITLFIYRDYKWNGVIKILLDTAITTATITMIIGTASLFAWILTIYRVPVLVAEVLTSITTNRLIMLVLLNIVFLIAGCILNTTSALILLVPILLPTVRMVGIDLIHFGVICVLNLCIGMLTPPVGVVLFVTARVGNIGVGRLVKALRPLWIVLLLVLILVTYYPDICLWLPSIVL